MKELKQLLGDLRDSLQETGGYVDDLKGFKKPETYPGLVGPEHEAALAKGFVDLGLVNPDILKHMDKSDIFIRKLRSSILRQAVKLLIKRKGKNTFLRDPESVTVWLYPDKQIKDELKSNIEEALEAMFEKSIPVKVAGIVGKTGFGWRFSASKLAAVLA